MWQIDFLNIKSLDTKFLVAPSMQSGYELSLVWSREQGAWFNLRPATIKGIAQGIAEGFLRENGIKAISRAETEQLVEEIVQGLGKAGLLSYYQQRRTGKGLVRALHGTICEVRGCGLKASQLERSSLVSSPRGRDFINILRAFEDHLQIAGKLDGAGLVQLAGELANQGIGLEGVFLVPDFMELSPLEILLFKRLACQGARVVRVSRPLLPPNGADQELGGNRAIEPWITASGSINFERVDARQDPGSPEDRGICLDQDLEIDMFRAYGISNEVREVLRRINESGLPLDQAAVGYVGSEYPEAFYLLARELGFKVTSAEGFSAVLRRPGRFMIGIIHWISHDFSSRLLVELLRDAGMEIRDPAGGVIAVSEVERLLSKAEVGWGRDRYRLLNHLAERLESQSQRESDRVTAAEPGLGKGLMDEYGLPEDTVSADGSADHMQSMTRSSTASIASSEDLPMVLRAIDQQISGWLVSIPVPDAAQTVSWREICSGAAEILKQSLHMMTMEELDQQAADALQQLLEAEGSLEDLRLGMDEAIRRLEELVLGTRSGNSGSKPGHLHIMPYRQLIWIQRPLTFLVGLDGSSFPGRAVQDSILFDLERQELHPGLKQSRDGIRTSWRFMNQVLSSRRGRLIMSYTSIDPVDMRENMPSAVILQVLRLSMGDAHLDYEHLLRKMGDPSGYIPGKGIFLDESEWWLQESLLRGQDVQAEALQYFEALRRAEQVRQAREASELGAFDGIIGPYREELDPCRTRAIMSSSRIELLGGCPYKYFCRYVLNVKPPELLEFQAGRWLQPHQRGSLLHELYHRFLKICMEQEDPLDLDGRNALIKNLARDLCHQWAVRIPPPTMTAWEVESSEIIRAAELFSGGMSRFGEYVPVLLEVPFGMGETAVGKNGHGLVEPLEIYLNQEDNFLLRGVIDRVDQHQDGHFAVWDYKTGSSREYSETGFIKQGQQIQHALYSMAAEEILRREGLPSAEVKKGGYYFPTQRGEGRLIERDESRRAQVFEALQIMFHFLGEGTFFATGDDKLCRYCDYLEVCRPAETLSRRKGIMENGLLDYQLEWRRLRDIE